MKMLFRSGTCGDSDAESRFHGMFSMGESEGELDHAKERLLAMLRSSLVTPAQTNPDGISFRVPHNPNMPLKLDEQECEVVFNKEERTIIINHLQPGKQASQRRLQFDKTDEDGGLYRETLKYLSTTRKFGEEAAEVLAELDGASEVVARASTPKL